MMTQHASRVHPEAPDARGTVAPLPHAGAGIRYRSILIGLLLSAFLSVASPYCNMVIQAQGMSADVFAPGALFLLLLIIPALALLQKIPGGDRWLRMRECKTIYVMLLIASAVPSWGIVERLLHQLAGIYYYATPGNDWAARIHPHLPAWAVPQDPLAVRYFFEGLPAGMTIPWMVWLRPALAWGSVIFAFYFVQFCIMVILRKQWIEKERLLFPLAQVPLAMMDEGDQERRFFSNPAMWIGFSLPFSLCLYQGLQHYVPSFPELVLHTRLVLFHRNITVTIGLFFVALGLAYLVNLDIAFSIWFFQLVFLCQKGMTAMIGYTLEGEYPLANGQKHQAMGALITLVLFGIWTARSHLRNVLRKALRNDASIDDSDEMMSYRAAVWGGGCGMLLIAWWLAAFGLPLPMVPVVIAAALVLHIGVSRIVAEGGLGFVGPPYSVEGFVMSGAGHAALGQQGIVSLVFANAWATPERTLMGASVANGLKVAEGEGRAMKRLLGALVLTVLVSFFSSGWMVIKTAYTHGALNGQHTWFAQFNVFTRGWFCIQQFNSQNPISWTGWLFTLFGSAVMGALMLLRYRFAWWPLHYVGFPLAGVYTIDRIWFSIFLAWLLKWAVLRYGGVRLFRRLKPAFLGLVLGQVAGIGFWLIVDFFTGMQGNEITFFPI